MSKFRRTIKLILFHISPKLNVWANFLYHYKYYGKLLSFSNPVILDEKIQTMKFDFYKDNSLVTKCADKYAVREYVEDKGCGEILNELYAAYDGVDEIDWDALPNKFIVKWNFGAGSNFICRDKSKINIEETKALLKKWRKGYRHYYKPDSEIHYKPIKPKLVCEKFIETEDGKLPVDYKIYCFNGKPMYLMIATERESGNPKFYLVDKKWELQRLNKAGKEAPVGFIPPKPEGYEKLFEYAEILAKPFPFVRADFYLENKKIIFGELTFTPAGGIDTNRLIEANEYYGSLVDLDYRG